MTEPLLHGAKIDARPATPITEGRTKLVQPEVVFIEFGLLRNGFQAVEKIELRVTSRCGKNKAAGCPTLRFVKGGVPLGRQSSGLFSACGFALRPVLP